MQLLTLTAPRSKQNTKRITRPGEFERLISGYRPSCTYTFISDKSTRKVAKSSELIRLACDFVRIAHPRHYNQWTVWPTRININGRVYVKCCCRAYIKYYCKKSGEETFSDCIIEMSHRFFSLRKMTWILLSSIAILVLSQQATCKPLSRQRRAWESDCPPGVWGCKRALLAIKQRVDHDCPPGVWGCKKDVIIDQDDNCPPGVWGCKRGMKATNNDCPPGVWGCKRGLFGSVKNWYTSSQKGQGRSKRSVEDTKEDCPPGVWGCKRENKKEEKGEEGCPPGVWGCKRETETKKAKDDCPPGVWGCKRETETTKTEDDCPPGVWGCKRETEETKTKDDCPPGVWGCKREKVPEMKDKKADMTSNDCPPGVWGCKREN